MPNAVRGGHGVKALRSVSGKLACGHTLGGVEWVSGSTGQRWCGCARPSGYIADRVAPHLQPFATTQV